ncbi:MAG: hypothetical protein Q7P63_12335 [Verrucomicrobiota bacterium JB022]|nr:hypothetical protein [Verrucomicrobiota bacterium JB022]
MWISNAHTLKRIAGTGLCLWGTAIVTYADYPSWWQEMGLVLPSEEPNNYGPVNQGQLKNFGLRAAHYLRFMLELDQPAWNSQWLAVYGGSAPDFLNTGNNFAVMNQGQGKFMANGFYEMMELHPSKLPGEFPNASAAIAVMLDLHHPGIWTYDRPWSGQDTEHYAPLLIGQLKFMFSFDLGAIGPWMDLDGDGIDDRLEWKVFNGLGAMSDSGALVADSTGDLTPHLIDVLESQPEIQEQIGHAIDGVTIVLPDKGVYGIAPDDLEISKL